MLLALLLWHLSTSGLTVPAGDLAADFTVTNDDALVERFEISAATWEQRDGVERRTRDDGDVLIFPRLFVLRPGERMRVRVGVLDADRSTEADYRVTIEQLFDPRAQRPGFHFLLAYDIPLFVAPARSFVDARISSVAVRAGRVRVTVRNDGNVHVFARRLTLRWRGETLAIARPFYVLPRSAMAVEFAVRGCGSAPATIVPDPQSRVPALALALDVPCGVARAVVSLRVNGVPRGEAVVVAGGQDVYVRARDVSEVAFPRRPLVVTIDGETYDSLDSTGASYVYDPAALALDVAYRAVTALRLSVPIRDPPRYENGSSANVAYAGTLARGLASAAETLTIAMPQAQARLGLAQAGRALYRAELDAAIFAPSQDGEMLFGDQRLPAGGALPALPLFGIGVSRGTSVRTSARRAPFERIAGTLRDPATIRVEVDGDAPIELGVERGTFSIDGIPRDARVVAIDDVTMLPVPVVVEPPLDAELVAPGWRELGVSAGVPRTCIYECARYRGFAAGAFLLAGDSLFVASGPHAEIVDGRAGAGYDLVASDATRALRLSAGIGPLDGVLASYEQRARDFSFGGAYGESGTPSYGANGVLAIAQHNLFETLNAAYRGARLSYTLQKNASFDARAYEIVDALTVARHAIRLDLEDRVTRSGGALSLGVLLPVAVAPWRETTLLGATIGAHDGPAAILAARIDAPSGLAVAAGANGEIDASYASDAIDVSASSEGLMTISGAVVILHGIHLVRDASGGYAVVAGEPGDRVRDGDGRTHVVRSRSGSAFPLSPRDAPTDVAYVERDEDVTRIARTSVSQLYPAPGAGELLVVTHARLFAVIGTVADARWRDGTMTLAGGASSPIGSDGMFYFERLAPGRYAARIIASGGSCAVVLVVPASTAGQINVGPVTCATTSASGRGRSEDRAIPRAVRRAARSDGAPRLPEVPPLPRAKRSLTTRSRRGRTPLH